VHNTNTVKTTISCWTGFYFLNQPQKNILSRQVANYKKKNHRIRYVAVTLPEWVTAKKWTVTRLHVWSTHLFLQITDYCWLRWRSKTNFYSTLTSLQWSIVLNYYLTFTSVSPVFILVLLYNWYKTLWCERSRRYFLQPVKKLLRETSVSMSGPQTAQRDCTTELEAETLSDRHETVYRPW
jgi:hypothetical protein